LPKLAAWTFELIRKEKGAVLQLLIGLTRLRISNHLGVPPINNQLFFIVEELSLEARVWVDHAPFRLHIPHRME